MGKSLPYAIVINNTGKPHMRTRDAALAVNYGQQARDCACGCGGGDIRAEIKTAARDAALNSLYKSEKTRDTWSPAAREAAARTRKMHAQNANSIKRETTGADPHRKVNIARLSYKDYHGPSEFGKDHMKQAPDHVVKTAFGADSGEHTHMEVRHVKKRNGVTSHTLATTYGSAGQSGDTVRYEGKVHPADLVAHHKKEIEDNA